MALYIVLEREIPGFDPFVNGKALGNAGKELEKLAKEAGVTPLMKFFSASPAELAEFAGDHGVELKGTHVNSAEQWFSADEGLQSVRGLMEAARKQSTHSRAISDLKEFESVLEHAQRHGVKWHLAVDF